MAAGSGAAAVAPDCWAAEGVMVVMAEGVMVVMAERAVAQMVREVALAQSTSLLMSSATR